MTADTAPVGARAPTQERSRRTVERLLAAAEAAFAEDGFERATVRSIATRAEVPVGSLYQFFTNKAALLESLLTDHLRAVDELFDELLGAAGDDGGLNVTVDGATRAVVGRIIELAAARPSFRSMLAGTATSGPFADAGVRLRARLAGRIAEALTAASPANRDLYDRAAAVCAEIMRGLLPRIVDEHGVVDDELRPELEVVIAAYLFEVKRRERS
ncbi:MAG: TetR/AcrR family transcriptional regulator [Actinomycetota bacterium]